MIKFKQKEYAEYDAMRSLYVELMKYSDSEKFEIIDKSALIPVLKGNNVVIEKFVISTSVFGKDKYRMYLKIGAKAKLPDEVRLPGRTYDNKLARLQLKFNKSAFDNTTSGKKPVPNIISEFSPNVDLSVKVNEILGDAILYDKSSRSLVLEFNSIQNSIKALNILPFGLNYKIYLLDS